MTDFFDETIEEELDFEGYRSAIESQSRSRKRIKAQNLNNEVGPAPPLSEETIAKREMYRGDFVKLHEEVFPNSTGVKPFGDVQKLSIQHGHHIFRHGGRLLKLEPRGYAKTTRIANESVAAVLLGMQDYILIVCSNVSKAEEILDSIKTELYDNDELLELFPGPIGCFRHLDDNPNKSRYQTYGGQPTYIKWGSKGLRFPVVPDEPSSGKFIEVRPLTNLKGLFHKVKSGPDAGKVYRPTLVVFDDPQTEDEARGVATEVPKIISNIKRSALKGGSHSKRVSAIMAITPVCHGDVAWHFEKNEPSWEIKKYKMVEKFPDQHERWMQEYAQIYLNFDRHIVGDRTRAQLRARKFVEDNYEDLHRGSEVSWDWAYGWDEDPQTECSALQHAYNAILDDSWEDFEYEYQCNTDYGLYDEDATIHAPKEQILNSILSFPRNTVPQWARKIVTHIDVNKDLLTYVTLASDDPLKCHVIDYGTYPKQPGLFSKRNLIAKLRGIYPNEPDYRQVLYLAIKDIVAYLARKPYMREDGIQRFTDCIGVDTRYEETYTLRACKETPFRNIVVPCWGAFVDADDPPLHVRWAQDHHRTYFNAVDKPSKDNTADNFWYDTDFFKTEVHKGFNLSAGVMSSITLYEPQHLEEHNQLAEHCNNEVPERREGKKTKKTKIKWEERMHQVDNEFFDNLTGCLALMVREGIQMQLDPNKKERKEHKKQDMQDWMNSLDDEDPIV